jgi:feruloyl esterase
VPLFSIIDGVRRGYAVAGTDAGHQTSDSTDAQWALGHPGKVRDFGDRALKVTHDAAQRITVAYTRRKPRLAYFTGCSDGGREALMVAQRYPRDYSGVVAGAPAAYWTTLMEGGAALGKRVTDPATRIPKAKLQALQSAALAACGGSVSYVADPASCHFNPEVLLCGAQDDDSCLTAPQVATAHAIYDGLMLTAAPGPGSGYTPGAEAAAGSWSYWITGETSDGLAMPQGLKYAWNYFAYLVRGDPAFRFDSITAEDARRSTAELGPLLNADNPDLAPFRRAGGRLLQYHGWNDPAIPASHSRAYYTSVAAKLGDPADFYKLYFVPGMLHCAGGPGPSGVDWLRHLEDWVEHGHAPGEIVANKSRWDAAPAGASQRLVPFQAR